MIPAVCSDAAQCAAVAFQSPVAALSRAVASLRVPGLRVEAGPVVCEGREPLTGRRWCNKLVDQQIAGVAP